MENLKMTARANTQCEMVRQAFGKLFHEQTVSLTPQTLNSMENVFNKQLPLYWTNGQTNPRAYENWKMLLQIMKDNNLSPLPKSPLDLIRPKKQTLKDDKSESNISTVASKIGH